MPGHEDCGGVRRHQTLDAASPRDGRHSVWGTAVTLGLSAPEKSLNKTLTRVCEERKKRTLCPQVHTSSLECAVLAILDSTCANDVDVQVATP